MLEVESSKSSAAGGGESSPSSGHHHHHHHHHPLLRLPDFCILTTTTTTDLKQQQQQSCYNRGSTPHHHHNHHNHHHHHHHHHHHPPPSPPLISKLSENFCGEKKKRIERKMSKSCPNYEVFLGGSCNPTTWRQKVAIPILQDQGISFYNPQVSHWEEALVELEYQAKQNAQVVFIVLDRNTRNVASMVEAAYMAGCGRKLVVVMDAYTGPGQLINGEPLSELEYQDLMNGFNTVRDLVERQEIPVFAEITHALNCTAKILKDDIYPQDLNSEDHDKPAKYPSIQLEDKLIKLRDAFINTSSEEITLSDARLVYKLLTGNELTNEQIAGVMAAKKEGVAADEEVDGGSSSSSEGGRLEGEEASLTLDEFDTLLTRCSNKNNNNSNNNNNNNNNLDKILSLHKVIGWPLPPPTTTATPPDHRDVYLGGSVGPGITWREEAAIPLLLKNNITFYTPSSPSPSSPSSSSSASPCGGGGGGECCGLMDRSQVLLFVVTDTTRGVSPMVLASHYIGLGRNVVLCVQMLTEHTLVDGEQLSRQALKDYNRGRTYLTDQANKDGIPVFSDVNLALECVVDKLQQQQQQQQQHQGGR